MKAQKNYFEALFVFVLSPFLVIPFIPRLLRKGNEQLVFVLSSVLVGFLSYLYIPTVTNDKVEYFKRYTLFRNYSYSDLLTYFQKNQRADFLFDHFIYLFSTLKLNFNIFFFLTGFFTFYSILSFVKKSISVQFGRKFEFSWYHIILIFSTLSLSGLFSNVRFLLAASIFIWAIYYYIFKPKLFIALILASITILLHFSYAFFIAGLLMFLILPRIHLLYRVLLILSLAFMILAENLSFLDQVISFFELPTSYMQKADTYIALETDYSSNAKILSFIKNLWYYLLCFYFIFYSKNNSSNFIYLLIVFMVTVNLTHSNIFIFGRYAVVISVLFSSFLFYQRVTGNLNNKWFILFVCAIILHLFGDILVLRNNILASYSVRDLFSIYSIFSKEITPIDFLRS